MSKRVLVVDDDENTVRFLSVALSENGYEPIQAYDGEEGLKKVQESKPDLILLDVMMPRKTGFVLFKQLRRNEDYKDIPVIIVESQQPGLAAIDIGRTIKQLVVLVQITPGFTAVIAVGDPAIPFPCMGPGVEIDCPIA